MNRESWANALKGQQPLAQVLTAKSAVGRVIPELHVGKGYRYGNLTWFPVWTDAPVTNRQYSTDLAAKAIKVGELDQATVGGLEIENVTDQNVLLFEGTLLEGGMQHRALTRSILVRANSKVQLPVVCVEHGRWGGTKVQAFGNKIAPARVRAAMRGVVKGTDGYRQGFADQGKVWEEVSKYAYDFNAGNASDSLVGIREQLDQQANLEKVPAALAGQRGVIIGIGGKPLALELFDHPDTLAERFESILLGYQPDAMRVPFKETPGYRVRDFATAISSAAMQKTELENQLRNEPNEYVASEALTAEEKLLHLAAFNPRHQLVLAA